MNEYISRDEACHRLHDAGGCDAAEEWAKGYDDGITEAIRIINEMPAANVTSVVYGRWAMSTDRTYMPQCTNCGAHPFIGYVPSLEDARQKYKFCPNCGAKMESEEEQ